MKSRGLGDSIEKFTKATGIKRVADMIPGGCGCLIVTGKHRNHYLDFHY